MGARGRTSRRGGPDRTAAGWDAAPAGGATNRSGGYLDGDALPGRGGPRGGPVDRPTEAVDMAFLVADDVDPTAPPRGDDPPYLRSDAPPGPWPGDYADDAYYDEPGFAGDDYGDADYGGDGMHDDDMEDELSERQGCRHALVAVAVIALVVLVGGWFGWSWVQGKIDPAGGPGDPVMVEIPEGTSTAGIGRVLADAGVISDATVWSWYTKLRDVGSIQAGSYEMRLNSSFGEAIDDLADDPLPPNTSLVTIPEGLTQAQLVTRLTDPEDGVAGFTPEGVQAALNDPAARASIIPAEQSLLEGTLFPESYAVADDETEAQFVQRMVAQFNDVATAVDLEGRAAAVGRTPYEVLIVASMIEREAGIPEDGPKVARVIYNRLAAEEALGIDATSCYEKGEIPCELTTAELKDNTPYDTRDQVGLPPTPIASPGRASIEAALAPAEGDWKYYVLDAEANDGSSYFTPDYEDFQAAKERCRDAGLGCG